MCSFLDFISDHKRCPFCSSKLKKTKSYDEIKVLCYCPTEHLLINHKNSMFEYFLISTKDYFIYNYHKYKEYMIYSSKSSTNIEIYGKSFIVMGYDNPILNTPQFDIYNLSLEELNEKINKYVVFS